MAAAVVIWGEAGFDALASALAVRRLCGAAQITAPHGLAPAARAFAEGRIEVGASAPAAAEIQLVAAGGAVPAVAVEPAHVGAVYRRRDASVPASADAPVVRSLDAALSTALAFALAEHAIVPSVVEATALALGIHEATGSLRAATTGERDIEALGWCARHGARQDLIAGLLQGSGAGGELGGEPLRAGAVAWREPLVVPADASVEEALRACRLRRENGVELVGADGVLVGSADRENLGHAVEHELGAAGAAALLAVSVVPVEASEPVSRLAAAFDEGRMRVAVFRDGTAAGRRIDDVVGVATRRDLLAELRPETLPRLAEAQSELAERLAALPLIGRIAEAVAAAAQGAGVYLVGGAVRDLLLGRDSLDVDLVVEGDGEAVAARLAERLGGRLKIHGAFGTARIRLEDGSDIDVATARSEHYEAPGALPAVEHASLRHDLHRRDFTVNAMAASLGPHDFGALYDPFGGATDLRAGRLRVLHPLSFVEDPTRILRGVRYEARRGLRLDRHAEELARAAARLGLVATVSGARIREELVRLLDGPAPGAALARLEGLGVLRALGSGLRADADTLAAIDAAEELRAARAGEARAWLLCLGLAARAFSPGELEDWLSWLRLRRRDAEAVAAVAGLAPVLAERLRAAAGDAEIAELLDGLALEIVLAAAAHGAQPQVERWLSRLRHVRLELDGEALQRELGLTASPELGRILRELRRRKLDGGLPDRAAELEAARGLVAAG